MTKDVIELAREAGVAMYPLDDDYCDAVGLERGTICRVPDIGIGELNRFAALVAARERERVAREFDRRAVLSDGGPAVGWYEPNEPAEIIRAINTEGEGNDRP